MLVLTRKALFRSAALLPPEVVAEAFASVGHSVLIGPDIRVRVLRVDVGGHVRLGIEAPRSVLVRRDEMA